MPSFLRQVQQGFIAFCAFVFLFLFSGSVFSGEQSGTLTIGVTTRLAQINPFFTYHTFSANILDIVYDQLINIDSKNNVTPNIAYKWEILDEQRRWVFYISEDVYFHDGKQLTANDVKKSFQVLLDSEKSIPLSDVLKNIEYIKIESKFKVSFYLKQSDRAFPFAVRMINIAPSHLFDKEGNPISVEYYKNPIGSGAFKVSGFEEKQVRLVAYKKYFSKPPILKEVLVRVFENDQETLSEYIKGNLDIVLSATTENFSVVKNIPHSSFFPYKNSFLYSVFLNTNDKNLKSSKVRQALNFAVNGKLILSKLSSEDSRSAGSIVSPNSTFFSNEIKSYPYRPKEAYSLLAEEGWVLDSETNLLKKSDKFLEISILVSKSDDLSNQIARFVERDLRNLGVKVSVKSKSIKDLTKQVFLLKDFQGAIFHYAYTIELVYDQIFWINPEKSPYNFTRYSNTQAHYHLRETRRAVSNQMAKENYAKFQKVLNEDPPAIYLFWKDTPLLVHKRVKGLKSRPLLLFGSLNEVYID